MRDIQTKNYNKGYSDLPPPSSMGPQLNGECSGIGARSFVPIPIPIFLLPVQVKHM